MTNVRADRVGVTWCCHQIDGDAADDVVATAAELRSEGKNVVTLFDPDIDADVVAKSIGNASVLKVGDKDDAGSTAV